MMSQASGMDRDNFFSKTIHAGADQVYWEVLLVAVGPKLSLAAVPLTLYMKLLHF